MKTKIMYKIVFLRMEFNVFSIIGIRKLKSLPDLLNFQNKKYVIDATKPTYISGKFRVFCFNVDNGDSLVFNEVKSLVNPADLDIIVGQKIIRELTSGVLDNAKDKIMYIILGVILGSMLMGLILVMYYTGKIEDMYKDQQSTTTTIGNIVPTLRLMAGGFKCL